MSNLDISSTMQKLLEEFDTKEALTREEINLVQQNIQELEQRVKASQEKLNLIASDRAKILSIQDKYKNLSFSSSAHPHTASSFGMATPAELTSNLSPDPSTTINNKTSRTNLNALPSNTSPSTSSTNPALNASNLSPSTSSTNPALNASNLSPSTSSTNPALNASNLSPTTNPNTTANTSPSTSSTNPAINASNLSSSNSGVDANINNNSNLFSFGQQLANSYANNDSASNVPDMNTVNNSKSVDSTINSLADALSSAITSPSSQEIAQPQPVQAKPADKGTGEDLWLDFNYENDDANNTEENKEAAKSMDDALRGLFR